MKKYLFSLLIVSPALFLSGISVSAQTFDLHLPSMDENGVAYCPINGDLCDYNYCPEPDSYWHFTGEMDGMTDGTGYCASTPPPFDECSNLPGIQVVVPDGLVQRPVTVCIRPEQVVEPTPVVQQGSRSGSSHTQITEILASSTESVSVIASSTTQSVEELQKQLIMVLSQLLKVLQLLVANQVK